MPFLLLPLVLLGVVFAIVVFIPVSLVLRYRAGRTRRQARPWVASLNIAALALSIVMWLTTIAFMSIWVQGVSGYAIAGLAAGGVLGIAGLALTRWDGASGSLHFTPTAWIVLFISVVVAARIAYGGWRTWHTWDAGGGDTSSTLIEGMRGSIAAAGIVLGYYLTFWLGVLRRVRRRG